MQLARFQRPRASQGFYGNGAPGLPAPGATMTPPAPTYPRMSAASTAAAMQFAPTPAAPVTTNPNLTPFQKSVNNQRAMEARSAATFAQGAPLPYKPLPTPPPATLPNASPDNTVQFDMSYSDGRTESNIAPLFYPTDLSGQAQSQQAPSPLSRAPAGQQYSGAHGVGPAAEQTAQKAKDAYIQRQNDTANAQDRGPGLGVNSYANADLQRDANTRANEAATTPNAKDEYYQAGAELRRAQATEGVPAKAEADRARGGAAATGADVKKQLLPGQIEQQKVKTKQIQQAGNAAESRALTAKEAVEDRKLAEQIKTREQNIRTDKRLTAGAKLALIHMQLSDLHKKREIAIRAGIRTDDPGGLNEQIAETMKQVVAGQAPAATQPAAGAPATQPTSSALQPSHINPTTGEKWALDPAKNDWVKVA